MAEIRTCIIIPIYNEHPSNAEKKSLLRNTTVLKYYDIYAIHPIGMNTNEYNQYNIDRFIPFDEKYFRSNKSYSRLLLSYSFYECFTSYDYMLIAQTDTYILDSDYSLEYFINMSYDYYGAPWPNGPFDGQFGIREYIKSIFVPSPKSLLVGNGGFSLRRISTTKKLVFNHAFFIKYFWRLNEDIFFSLHGRNRKDYSSCPYNIASQFSLETNMDYEISNGNIPYAIHAWEKYLSKKLQNDLIR